jgi:23S rRNA (cytosine1962-C5)-methyltransferase
MNAGPHPVLDLLRTPRWADYGLLDTGAGAKLERFGPHVFVRPEPQALWARTLPKANWDAADGVFESAGDEEQGGWRWARPVPSAWEMSCGPLRFLVQATSFRHMGVFPEQACHWEWAVERIRAVRRPVRLLNLFGYTGLFTLAVAAAGAHVTHVDASKKVVAWAPEPGAFRTDGPSGALDH